MVIRKAPALILAISFTILYWNGLSKAQIVRMNVGYSAISGDALPAWVAKDAGIFEKNGLDVQLVFYRGFNECKASRWLSNGTSLHAAMRAVFCVGGETQIARILRHSFKEAEVHRIGALVFVGDAMEEKLDELCALAGKLALRGVPVFVFHEGSDPTAARAFKEIARLTSGAYCRFDANSADELRALLGAVAAYAAGGRRALADYGKATGGAALLLAHRLNGSE